MTPRELQAWIRTARAGDRVTYFEGFLALSNGLAHDDPNCSRAITGAAWRAYLDGQVSLVQRRLGDGLFAYIAERTFQTAKAEVSRRQFNDQRLAA